MIKKCFWKPGVIRHYSFVCVCRYVRIITRNVFEKKFQLVLKTEISKIIIIRNVRFSFESKEIILEIYEF